VNSIREHIALRFIWALMAIHILNCSIDAPDSFSDEVTEDLTLNDIESISELVLENILGLDNLIKEHDEQDNINGYSLELHKLLLFFHTTYQYFSNNLIYHSPQTSAKSSYKDKYFSLFHPEIVSPPPQA